MSCDVELEVVTEVDQQALVSLYSSTEWVAYTADPESLFRAVSNSAFIVTAVVEWCLTSRLPKGTP